MTTELDYLIVLYTVIKKYDKEYADFIYNRAILLNTEYTEQEKKQILTPYEKKNYIYYDELLNKFDNLLEIYNKNPTKQNIIKLVLLGLYVLQPPIRNNYNDIEIINDTKDIKDGYNYIFDMSKIGGINGYILIIDNDKVSKNTPQLRTTIENNILTNILNVYIDIYCKNNIYLFENTDGTSYTKRQINYIIKSYFKDRILTIHNLRSTYISQYYKQYHSIIKREKLAKNMRHTRQTAELIYYKID